jgi:hypothetical protein
MGIRGPEDSTPLVNYTDFNLWSNPEENQQYQVEMNRVTGDFGVSFNFGYMNKWRVLPKKNTFYHVYSIGGLSPGFWNFKNTILGRNPLDRWCNAASLAKARGIQLDIYNSKGYQASRGHCWIMVTYDGLVLIAIEKMSQYPIDLDSHMHFRCYTPSVLVDLSRLLQGEVNNPFTYETMVYENAGELATLMARYSYFKAKPGYTGVYYNGAFFNGAPNAIPGIKPGDIVEFWHDPTVIRTEIYQYKNLADFYSDLDKKRKVILHPAKRKGDFTIRYFDDNDYFLVGPNKKGLYLHRNSETTVRQLTHVDVSIAADYIESAAAYHPDLSDTDKISIMIMVRKTDWEYKWPNEHHRIRYLYRFPDADIIKAFTGARANMPEWTAAGLETGATMGLLRRQWGEIKKDDAILSTGYNAATRVLSETPLRATYLLGQRGIEIPVTYRPSCTAWEHDSNGKLLGFWNMVGNRYYAPRSPTCAMVEFTMGEYSRKLDTTVTNQNLPLEADWDYQVYTCAWSIVLGELVGEWTNVTDDSTMYVITDGVLTWKGLDKVNKRGIIISNKKILAYQFQLNHLDRSLAFALTEIYEDGGLLAPVTFAQVDIWLNGHPLIDKVDWIYDDQYCYINNKEFLVDGPQTITVRAHGLGKDVVEPNTDTELGYVDGGVIGRFNRYNLRGDRVTRTVINGALYLTDEVPRAERSIPDGQWSALNGRPYMVKHQYCPVKYVDPVHSYPYRARSREVDQRVSDYMTLWLPKPRTAAEEITWESASLPAGSNLPAVPNLQDKYRLYSPFLNVVVNGVLNNLIPLPAMGSGETAYSMQDVKDAVAPYIWWLKYDPVIRKYDRRYFAITPFANYGKLTVSDKELIFFKQVNDLYLESVCVIEGYFEVNNNV